jgi:hypothetical protein
MLEEAIIKTLCYRDLFDYPLTEEEMREFLVGEFAHPPEIQRVLAQLVAERKIGVTDGFFHLLGREKIARTRREREEISEHKWARALKLARLLRVLPWVRAVFLTGALAAGNAEKAADLDFLVVTRVNRVWLTRLISYTLFTLLGVRRKREVEEAPDRVCLNMFLADTALAVPEDGQNLFTAHEVALARPFWAKDYLHRRFLGENPWVKKFLPNLNIPETKIPARSDPSLMRRLADSLLTVADLVLRRAQLIYMAKRRTRETVERNRIMFHPIDLSREILAAYRVKLYSELHRSPNFKR